MRRLEEQLKEISWRERSNAHTVGESGGGRQELGGATVGWRERQQWDGVWWVRGGTLDFEFPPKKTSVTGFEAVGCVRAKRSDTTAEGTEGCDQEGNRIGGSERRGESSRRVIGRRRGEDWRR